MTERQQQDKNALDMLKLKNLMMEVVANAPENVLAELKTLHEGIESFKDGSRIPGTNELTQGDFGDYFCDALVSEVNPDYILYKKVANILSVSNEASENNITEAEVDRACYLLRKELDLE